MRTEKEIKEKILELKTDFLSEENVTFNLKELKRTIKILNWVLGKEWVKDRVPSNKGARLKGDEK